jgi:hypothetical protein
MPDASPVKWHLAHTTWFFETFLLEARRGYHVFDPAYRVLFNSYYNGVGERHPRPERGLLSRPSLQDVLAYRGHVDEAMLKALGADVFDPSLVELGLQHEQQHQELILTDLKHLLSRNPLKPAYQKQWPLTPIRARAPHWIGFQGGLHEVGQYYMQPSPLPAPNNNILINQQAWDSLPDDLKEMMDLAARMASLDYVARGALDDARAMAEMQEAGIEVVQIPDEEWAEDEEEVRRR